MSAASKLPPIPMADANARVIVGARTVECDWCTCDAAPYTRIVENSAHASEDTIHLCDACARLLVLAVKRRRRALRLGRVIEPWTKGFYVRVLVGKDIARELAIRCVDISREDPFLVSGVWYRRADLQPATDAPPEALRRIRRGTAG